MKNKKLLFIGLAVVVLIAGAVAFLLLRNPKEVTLTFNTDGGNNIAAMKVEKGKTAKLPTPTKEGFTFNGWSMDGSIVTDNTIYNADATLKALWNEKGANTFTITFDANGGAAVEKVTLECDKEVTLPKTTRKGYTFVSWTDSHGKAILDGALLTCEDIKLKATWTKETTTTTTKKTTTTTTKKTTTTTTTVKPVTYTCPDGYTLDGTKCVNTKAATLGCDIQHEKEVGGKCYSVRTYKAPICRVQTGVNPGSYTPILHEGNVYKESRGWACYYQKSSSNTCDSTKKIMGICYDYVQHNGPDFNPCSEHGSDYEYMIGNALYGTVEKGTGAATGCYKPTDKHYLCEEGYTLSNNKCVKTIDATKK